MKVPTLQSDTIVPGTVSEPYWEVVIDGKRMPASASLHLQQYPKLDFQIRE